MLIMTTRWPALIVNKKYLQDEHKTKLAEYKISMP